MNAHVGRLQAPDGRERDRAKVLSLPGADLLADPAGVLYWPEERMLVVADLHLEKGSSFAARRRMLLPPYDTAATLMRLAAAIARLAPRRVVALGDSFHDNAGPSRLAADDAAALRAMQAGRDWLWIAGNHDPAPLRDGADGTMPLQGDHADEHAVGAIRFRHEPNPSPHPSTDAWAGEGEIAGHLHPVAVVGGRAGGSLRRRCFVADGRRCLMPAFGAYAGGLNLRDPAIAGLFGGGRAPVLAHVLGRDAVYTVAPRQCLADARRFLPRDDG